MEAAPDGIDYASRELYEVLHHFITLRSPFTAHEGHPPLKFPLFTGHINCPRRSCVSSRSKRCTFLLLNSASASAPTDYITFPADSP
jgi:hypothetical protein